MPAEGIRPRLLDLFCGAGGAAMGYYRAGFDVMGVDIEPQPRYPFDFVQGDALRYLQTHWPEFDAFHASPPCQGYSRLRHLPWLKGKSWTLLIEPCREMLQKTTRPWIMENVEDAPMPGSFVLCGQMFGLPLYRHRRFESPLLIMVPEHQQHKHVIGHGRMVNDRRKGPLNASQHIVTVAGGQFRKADGERAMGISWMTKRELSQAIPPAYTEYIGEQLLRHFNLSSSGQNGVFSRRPLDLPRW